MNIPPCVGPLLILVFGCSHKQPAFLQPLKEELIPPALPQTFVGTAISTKLVGTVYFDKSCISTCTVRSKCFSACDLWWDEVLGVYG